MALDRTHVQSSAQARNECVLVMPLLIFFPVLLRYVECWFLWLHYFDPHSYYQAHPGFLEIDGVPGPKQRYDSDDDE